MQCPTFESLILFCDCKSVWQILGFQELKTVLSRLNLKLCDLQLQQCSFCAVVIQVGNGAVVQGLSGHHGLSQPHIVEGKDNPGHRDWVQ